MQPEREIDMRDALKGAALIGTPFVLLILALLVVTP